MEKSLSGDFLAEDIKTSLNLIKKCPSLLRGAFCQEG
jgi:hypothetical protein